MILVTGANGFLGQYVCRQLLDSNREVCALVRDREKMKTFDRVNELTIREADLRDPVMLRETLRDINIVIHCAAVVSFDPADCDLMMETNVEGTRNLVNACLEMDLSSFVHVSSVAALGRIAQTGTVDEGARWQDSGWNTCYGKSKYQAEMEVWRGISEGLMAVIVNPSVIIGRPVPGAISNRLFDFVRNEPAFYPAGNLNYVDVRDVCTFIIEMLETPKYGERYILNAESIPYQTFFQEAAQRMKVRPPKKVAGKFALRMALLGDWLRKLFTGKKRSFTRETLRLSTSQIYFSNEKASRELNFTFAPLSDTLDWILTE